MIDFNNIKPKEDMINDPTLMVIVGPVKSGKSSICNNLSALHNWLILDTQIVPGYNNSKGAKVIRLIGLEPPMDTDAIDKYKNIKNAIENEMLNPVKDLKKIKAYTEELKKVKYWETYKRKKDLKDNECYLSDITQYYTKTDDNGKFINECKYDGVIVDLFSIIDQDEAWSEYSAARKWCSNFPDFILDKTRISILDLPGVSGSRGWEYLRNEIKDVISDLIRIFGRVILIAHLKDKFTLEQDKTAQLNEKQIDLRGKTASIILSEADACGFMTRKDNKGVLSFTAKRATIDSRCGHLFNKDIEISQKSEDGSITTNWEKVFTYFKKQKKNENN